MTAFESNVVEISDWDNFFTYNPASRHRRRIIHRLIKKFGIKFESILDVGCGDGRLLEEMGRHYHKDIYGIELGPSNAPRRLREDLKGFYRMDIQKEAASGTFDLILCTEVLEHLKNPEAAVKNLNDMSNGYLIITVPGGTMTKTDMMMGHLRHYNKTSILSLLKAAGFEEISCFQWGFPFHSIYRYLLRFQPDQLIESFAGNKKYSFWQVALSQVLNTFFYLNSFRMGSQLFYIGRKKRT